MSPGGPNSAGAGAENTPGGSPVAGAVADTPVGRQLPSDPQAIARALLLAGPSLTGAVEAVRAALDALQAVIEALRARVAPTVPATALMAADAAWASLAAMLAGLGLSAPELVVRPLPSSEIGDLVAGDRPPLRGQTVAGALGITRVPRAGGVTARVSGAGGIAGRVPAGRPGLGSSLPPPQEEMGITLVANAAPSGRTADDAGAAEPREMAQPPGIFGQGAPDNLVWTQTFGLCLLALALFGTARLLKTRHERRKAYWSY
jgi:hypothetical protein